MAVKITYCVSQRLTFRGTVEVDEDTYEAMQEAEDNEEALGELILDCIDRNDPQDWEIDSVDEVEKVA